MTESDETSPPPESDELSGLSYEAARSQLIEVVNQLETGGVPLDESLALWERGERLAQVCQRWLDGAQAKIDAARSQDPPVADGS
ncbi:MAG TPA: exodeoxyribonuclease VII small subunit [Microlunatus sp.]|nr:exodeoxyribonuclease VII small subunit [Microlunatus sp.]